MIDTVLFDLDGTLLPLDQDVFIEKYFEMLAGAMVRHGLDPKQTVKGVMYGTMAMLKNDGTATNDARFWKAFSEFHGRDMMEYEPKFDAFYRTDFSRVKEVTFPDSRANECVKKLKSKGYTVAVATSPVFPAVATRARMQWAGLDEGDFALVTTYENCTYCKPNFDYYREILAKIDKMPEQCIMVGNDFGEDMCVREMGMQTFWLDTFPLNRENLDTEGVERGGFDDLLDKINALPDLN